MSLRRLIESFCLRTLGLISISIAILCSVFGRLLKAKTPEETLSSRTVEDEFSDHDEDMNDISNSTFEPTQAPREVAENPQQTLLLPADASIDINRAMKTSDNVLDVKPADELNEEDTGERIICQEKSKEETTLKDSHLKLIKTEPLDVEHFNDQKEAIVKADVDDDEKQEHPKHFNSSKPSSIVTQGLKQERSRDLEYPTVLPKTSLNIKIKLPKRSNRALKEEAAQKTMTSKQKRTTHSTRYGAGIENHSNSCYLDSTLFALLYKEDVFDGRLLNGEEAKETRDKTSEDVTNHLIKIAHSLRLKGYCPSSYVTNLRKSMRHINERIISSMMDVDEFLANLLGKALHLNPFVMYCTKQGIRTGNFYHQILINPNIQREEFGTVQDLLEESMKMQQLTFDGPPKPALIIKMPRSNGRLVGHQQIIPNLELDIFKMLTDSCDEGNHVYELRAVITLYALHYTAYVRRSSTANGESVDNWEYFNDLPPTIREVDSLDSLLSNINNDEFNSDFGKVTRNIHVCIYNPCPPKKSDEASSKGFASDAEEYHGIAEMKKEGEDDDVSYSGLL